MSGFSFVPPAAGAHQAEPVDGSWYSEKTQRPASLVQEMAYPLTAVCAVCCGRIRLESVRQVEWQHVPVARADPAG